MLLPLASSWKSESNKTQLKSSQIPTRAQAYWNRSIGLPSGLDVFQPGPPTAPHGLDTGLRSSHEHRCPTLPVHQDVQRVQYIATTKPETSQSGALPVVQPETGYRSRHLRIVVRHDQSAVRACARTTPTALQLLQLRRSEVFWQEI